MFNITEQNTWPAAVRGYSTNTPVLGGDNTSLGDSNLSLKDLTDRTAYLYSRLGRFEDVVLINAAVTVGVASKYKLNKITASGNLTITIDDVATFPIGAILPFKIKCADKKAVTFQTTAAQLIEDGNIAVSKMWACDGEEFKLVAVDSNADGIADLWLLIDAKGNWDKVGQDDLKRFQPRNTVIADGCRPEVGGALYLRADFPRLWDKISGIAIDDSIWLSGITYQSFFSKGNGITTFRVADLRALFYRGLDLGRAIRLGQLDNTPGSYEPDDNKQHSHAIATTNSSASNADGADPIRGTLTGTSNSRGSEGNNKTIALSGSSEAKPKNAGFLPIIYY